MDALFTCVETLRDIYPFGTVDLGVDEMNWRKGQNKLTVIADLIIIEWSTLPKVRI